jgi:hypothetical protein
MGLELVGIRLDEARTLLDRAVAKLHEISSLKSSLTGVTKTISEVLFGARDFTTGAGARQLCFRFPQPRAVNAPCSNKPHGFD